jgi:outer membrane protein TolC
MGLVGSGGVTVLDAERAALDAEYQTSAARTLYLVETVALYKALAGGWPQWPAP